MDYRSARRCDKLHFDMRDTCVQSTELAAGLIGPSFVRHWCLTILGSFWFIQTISHGLDITCQQKAVLTNQGNLVRNGAHFICTAKNHTKCTTLALKIYPSSGYHLHQNDKCVLIEFPALCAVIQALTKHKNSQLNLPREVIWVYQTQSIELPGTGYETVKTEACINILKWLENNIWQLL